MFEEDWMMRQVENMVNFLTAMALKKKSSKYEVLNNDSSKDTDTLHLKLIELISSCKINEAENLLFESIDKNNKRYLEVAIDFYSRVNDLDNKALEKSEFSREEIEEGLKDIADIFGIVTI